MSKIKPVKAWAGVCDNEIQIQKGGLFDGFVDIFRTRAIARRLYRSVIHVEIRPVEKKKGKVK